MKKEYICENCSKKHFGVYGSGRFCSSFCARSFSTNKDNHLEQKLIKCSNCNKEVYVNKRAKNLNYICIECKQHKKQLKQQEKLINQKKTRQNNLNKYDILNSPYSEFDTVYENIDKSGDKYLYFTKHGEDNKIIKRAKVYLYRYIIEYKFGRKLNQNEVIHHIDFNHFNNIETNLIVVDRNIHNKIHKNILTITEVINNKLYIYY